MQITAPSGTFGRGKHLGLEVKKIEDRIIVVGKCM